MTENEIKAMESYFEHVPYEQQDEDLCLWYCINYLGYFKGGFHAEFKNRRAKKDGHR